MKKTILLLSLTLITSIAFVLTFISCQEKQSGFVITANIEGLPENSKVVLSETESQKVLDSAFVKNGSFNFEGFLQNTPIELSIVVLPIEDGGQAKPTSLFMGNEQVEIAGSVEVFPSMLKIKGSEYNKLKVDLEQKTEPYNTDFDKNIEKMISIRNNGNWNDSLQNVYWGKDGVFDKIDNQITNINKEFVAENINTHFGLRKLYRMRKEVPKEFLITQFEKVDATLKNTDYAKALAMFLESKPLNENDKFYNFTAENQSGEIVEFKDYFNDKRYVLLEFYAPHCPWCKLALPEIKELAKNKKDSLKVVTFYVDNNKKDWQRTNKINEIPWESLWDKNGRYSQTYIQYRIDGTPTYYLFDSDGKMVEKWTGFNKENTIDNITARLK